MIVLAPMKVEVEVEETNTEGTKSPHFIVSTVGILDHVHRVPGELKEQKVTNGPRVIKVEMEVAAGTIQEALHTSSMAAVQVVWVWAESTLTATPR
jgi:hypothetical protein